ncbi:hypothetical protein, partial [Cellulomonas iranensis]|uniref:hypothetical protein n=1 Tax=Cellulomonas iranensis TaxID=76862 RepID=UPI001C4FE638
IEKSMIDKSKGRREFSPPAFLLSLQRFQLRMNRWNLFNYLFLRIIRRKTASRFCWQCYEQKTPLHI